MSELPRQVQGALQLAGWLHLSEMRVVLVLSWAVGR